MFLHRDPDAVLGPDDLAGRLGQRVGEIVPATQSLCGRRILRRGEGLVLFEPADDQREIVDGFFNACQDHQRRLALIALVLETMGPKPDRTRNLLRP